MARKGLGRGLESILGDVPSKDKESDARAKDGVRLIPIGDIAPDPNQPRKQFDDESLAELAASMEAHGVLQPILVRPRGEDGRHLIIAGERRWRAAAKAKLHEIPALVRQVEESVSAELALIENIQRTDLNPMEEADAYIRMRDVFGHKATDIAKAVGKSRSHVANMLRLEALPDEVKGMVSAGALSMGHARALLGADDPVKLAYHIIDKGLSVRETEKLAGASKPSSKSSGRASSPKPSSSGNKDADTKSLERDLEEALGLSVAIEHTKKGGTVTLTYDTLEQLDDVCRRLIGTSI